MYLPPIESNCNYEPFVSGDVTIAPDVAIAPGAILQAAPDSRIAIASGVCIGMGAIIHAYNGTIEIEEGATIGAGVLIVGKAKIAAKACIGSLTTVLNCDLEPEQTVAAGSILGDTSRKVSENFQPSPTPIPIPTPTNVEVGTRYNTFIQPKPVSIPETSGAADIEEEMTTSIDSEEEPQPPSMETRYNTLIQPKPISIPETSGAADIEEEIATSIDSEEE
ncbi:MAG: transferase, partial [Okeania sp. SIO2H7]|nr:transferase [Okeania sp. SIO2H7]